MGILSGVIGDSSAGIAEYSRAIHSLGANDVPSFLSAGSALGLEVVLTALFLYVIFDPTSAVAKPGYKLRVEGATRDSMLNDLH